MASFRRDAIFFGTCRWVVAGFLLEFGFAICSLRRGLNQDGIAPSDAILQTKKRKLKRIDKKVICLTFINRFVNTEAL